MHSAVKTELLHVSMAYVDIQYMIIVVLGDILVEYESIGCLLGLD